MVMKRALLLLTSCVTMTLAACSEEPPAEQALAEGSITADQIVLPNGDACSGVLRELAEGVAISTSPGSRLEDIKKIRVVVVTVPPDHDRTYDVVVTGPDLTVDGQAVPNNQHFTVVLSKDASSLCWVIGIQAA